MRAPPAPLRGFPPRGGDGAAGPAEPDPGRPRTGALCAARMGAWLRSRPPAPLRSFRPRWGVHCAGLWALLLAGCAPSGGDSWFPLVAGWSQTYEVRVESEEPRAPEAWTLRVGAPVAWDGESLPVRHHSQGVNYLFKVDEQGIRRVATRVDIDEEPTADKEPMWVLKAPYAVGTEWTTTTVPYLILRKNEHPRELRHSHRAVMTWRIEAVDETVETPKGRFSPCLKVVGRASLNLYTDPVNGFTNVPLVSREWYCRGQGLVRFEREEKVPAGFLVGGSLTAEWVR